MFHHVNYRIFFSSIFLVGILIHGHRRKSIYNNIFGSEILISSFSLSLQFFLLNMNKMSKIVSKVREDKITRICDNFASKIIVYSHLPS